VNSLYDGEIHYVDSQIGRIVERLDAEGLRNDTVIIITSDHGESLGEHDYYHDHGDSLYDGQLRIPLVIYSRGARARVSHEAMNMGLMQAVIDILGVDGEASSPSVFSPSSSPLIFESTRCVKPTKTGCYPIRKNAGKIIAAQKDGLKYILTPTRDGVAEEVYELGADPGEMQDLSGGWNAYFNARGLRAEVERVKPAIAEPAKNEESVDEATIDALKAMGYI